MIAVPVAPIARASLAECRYTTNTTRLSRAAASTVSNRKASKASPIPLGRFAPREIATEIVPGPVVSGSVNG